MAGGAGEAGKVLTGLGDFRRFGSEHGAPLVVGLFAVVFDGGGDHAGHFLGACAEESARKLAFFVVVADRVALNLVAVDGSAERDQIVYVSADVLVGIRGNRCRNCCRFRVKFASLVLFQRIETFNFSVLDFRHDVGDVPHVVDPAFDLALRRGELGDHKVTPASQQRGSDFAVRQ